MYNMKFHEQLEAFERDLWGSGVVDVRDAARRASRTRYVPPPGVETIPCVEDTNGEWIPDPNYVSPGDEGRD
ncbi:hypothetical protein CMI48_02190 [Candidatus Pacearchaeota archaeon]|nr:hypothetical protein [Candidatus Pacearchaeota archaeon]|tara:strand:+ start:824 stop:1039 length:216 start_codon:yes stop_codon:yes gene_type:complete